MKPVRLACIASILSTTFLGAIGPAHATLITSNYVATVSAAGTSAPSGSLALQPTIAQVGTQNGTFSNTGSLTATYASTGADGVVQGNGPTVSGVATGYSAPFTSPSTQTSLPYFSTGIGTIDISVSAPETFLGLLWGSVDATNLITFYSGQNATGTVLGTVSGVDVATAAAGAQSYNGSRFVAINFSNPFESFTATSQQPSFEFAAVTATPTPIPEPMSVALLGIGLAGLTVAIGRPARRKFIARHG